MKKLLQILCVSVAVFSVACSEKTEEIIEQQLKLTKLTVTDTDSEHAPFTYTYTYNDKGAIYQLGEKSNNGAYDNVTTHLYDNQARLVSAELLGKGYGAHFLDAYSYDVSSRMTDAYHTYYLLHDPVRETTPLTTKFSYSTSGRISRIDKPDSGPAPSATFLTYDVNGNVVKQQRYYTTANGELGALINEFTFTYDDKKNPYYKMGAPNFLYGYTMVGFISYSEPLSPNNMKQVTIKTYGSDPIEKTITFQYEYNSEGFPTKVKHGNVTHTLEYTLQ